MKLKSMYLLSSLALLSCSPAYAVVLDTKDAYVNVAGGYQWSPDNTSKHQNQSSGFAQKEHGFVNAAVGIPVHPLVDLQLEYAQNKASSKAGVSGKQETTSLVANIPVWQPVKALTAYGIVGAGYTQVKSSVLGKAESATGILGVGVNWKLNPSVTLLAEGRGQYVGTDNYWQPQALVGVKVHPYQVFKNATGK